MKNSDIFYGEEIRYRSYGVTGVNQDYRYIDNPASIPLVEGSEKPENALDIGIGLRRVKMLEKEGNL